MTTEEVTANDYVQELIALRSFIKNNKNDPLVKHLNTIIDESFYNQQICIINMLKNQINTNIFANLCNKTNINSILIPKFINVMNELNLIEIVKLEKEHNLQDYENSSTISDFEGNALPMTNEHLYLTPSKKKIHFDLDNDDTMRSRSNTDMLTYFQL